MLHALLLAVCIPTSDTATMPDYLSQRDSVVRSAPEPLNDYETNLEKRYLREKGGDRVSVRPTYFWYPGQPEKDDA